jgi:hypothetical protein
MAAINPLHGLIELIEKSYGLKVLGSHYILVDERFKKYNMMLKVNLPLPLKNKFLSLYEGKSSAMHVAWNEEKDGAISFYAEIGNNILLLLDTLRER